MQPQNRQRRHALATATLSHEAKGFASTHVEGDTIHRAKLSKASRKGDPQVAHRKQRGR